MINPDANLLASNYSRHLFWDIDMRSLDLNQHKELLVNRVLDYGFFADWKQLNTDLGLEEIGIIARNLRDLDVRAVSFISLLTDIDITQFRCYTHQRSIPQHWHF
jgi:hypothetical protein